MPIKVILVDDHKIMREGLRALLDKDAGIAVIAEAEGGREAVRLALELTPDVVVMDITMPDLSGIEATRRIRASLPEVKVIALSMHADRKFVREMLSAGASGYLLKDAAYEELNKALHVVCNGQTLYLSPELVSPLQDGNQGCTKTDTGKCSDRLSRREDEILKLIVEGMATCQIAESLCISEKTVAAHRSNIMHKLGVKSIAELVKYAVREGITSVSPLINNIGCSIS